MSEDLANTFWDSNSDWITALISIVVAFLAAFLLDRALAHRGPKLAAAVSRGELSPETDTRLRFIRRLVYAVIILLGVAIALAQFDGVNRLAASLLASGAIAAAVLGFAARQTLANFVAGIMLAVTQPLRVGDWVFVEDQYGVVDDIRLTYTFLRTLGGQQVVIPNEKLASGILRNDTLGDGVVGLDVHIWLPRDGRRGARRSGPAGGHGPDGDGRRDERRGLPPRRRRRALPAARAHRARGGAAPALPRAAARRGAPGGPRVGVPAPGANPPRRPTLHGSPS